MPLWRRLTRGIRVLVRPNVADAELADELQHYVEQATEAHVARGVPDDEARRLARMEIGNVTIVREQVRSGAWEDVIVTALTDLRYAARGLRAAPGFTAITVLTLAIGIGGTAAIFSAVKPVLFEPLPYPHPDRVAMILELRNDGGRNSGTFGLYRAFAERSRSFEAVAVFKPWQPTVTGDDQPERFEGQRVSAGYFRSLGVAPMVGRDFEPSDDRFHGPNVVILSDGLWRRRFAADPAIVGREITLDDALYTIVGVMPGGFDNVLAPSASVWAPLQYDPSLPAQGREWGHHLRTVGRLRAGVRMDQAAGEIDTIGRTVLNERRPVTYDPATRFTVLSLHSELTRGVRPALLAMLAAVALVLVIACVNVTNLVLARGVHRRGEFALRAALGAGRGRLIRQLLTESLLMAVMGGVVGLGVAVAGVRALVALSPPGLPRAGAITVDATTLAFGLGLTTLIGLAFGLVPALQAAGSDPQQELQHGSPRTAGRHRRTRSLLVIAEVAIALVLLVSSGLLLRSLERLFAVPAGFDAAELLTMQVTVGHRFESNDATHRFFDAALEAVRRVPGVASAGFTSQLPLSGDRDEYGAQFEAGPSRPAATFSSFRYAVSPDYIETVRVPLRSGRLFDPHDGPGSPLVALISESLAMNRFEGDDPIGQRVTIGPAGPYTIVGVVGDVKQMSLALNDSDAVYTPAAQWRFADRVRSLVVRARGNAAALAPAVRQAIWSVDKDQPIQRVATFDDLLAASAAERRFALLIFETFALAALVLATAGLYGVLSGAVAERTREIGVRAALGASRRSILALVVRQGMTLTGIGVVAGLAAAAAASQTLVTLLFGISRLDPITYVGVTTLLAAASAVACAVPAWRAARVDPAITLRAE
ncbi:MAG TPA: ABC transporter permease [Vicinamibacterales bacterium]|nr:ABC transporter permease [Vicinamibacterales bacterium]